MKTVIRLSNVVDETISNLAGKKLFDIIDKHLENGSVIYLSLLNTEPMSTSFFNSSFGKLLEKYGPVEVKSKLKLVDYKMAEALRLRSYFERYNKISLSH